MVICKEQGEVIINYTYILVQSLGWNLSILHARQLVLKDLQPLSVSKYDEFPQDYGDPQIGEVCGSSLPTEWKYDLIPFVFLWVTFRITQKLTY